MTQKLLQASVKLLNLDFVMSEETQIKQAIDTKDYIPYNVRQEEQIIKFVSEKDKKHAFSIFLDKVKYTYSNEEK